MSEDDKPPIDKINDAIQRSRGNKEEQAAIFDWMIRPCSYYKAEYDECTSIKGRFHQYFIYGEMLDCNQREKDHRNCRKWTSNKDEAAKIELVDSEMQRREERLKAHYDNDVWKVRDKPPEDWNKPLPEWMVKRDEVSYLAEKARTFNQEKFSHIELDTRLCTIM